MSDEANPRQKNLVLQISAMTLGTMMNDLYNKYDEDDHADVAWFKKGSKKLTQLIDNIIVASEELIDKVDKKYPDAESQAKFLREQAELLEKEQNELLNQAEIKRKAAEKAKESLKAAQAKKKLNQLPSKNPEATDDASIRFGLLELK